MLVSPHSNLNNTELDLIQLTGLRVTALTAIFVEWDLHRNYVQYCIKSDLIQRLLPCRGNRRIMSRGKMATNRLLKLFQCSVKTKVGVMSLDLCLFLHDIFEYRVAWKNPVPLQEHGAEWSGACYNKQEEFAEGDEAINLNMNRMWILWPNC